MSLVTRSELTELQSNIATFVERKTTGDATRLVKGKIQIANHNEVKRGLNDEKAITPKALIDAIKDKDSSITREVKKLIAEEIASSKEIPKNSLDQLKIDLSTQVKKLINDFLVNDSRIIDEIVFRILSDDKYMSNIAGASAKYKK